MNGMCTEHTLQALTFVFLYHGQAAQDGLGQKGQDSSESTIPNELPGLYTRL